MTADSQNREEALEKLAEEAQELDMGYTRKRWDVGSRCGRRVITARNGRRVKVKCDCGESQEVALSSFIQSRQCRGCAASEREDRG